jgi:rod shape-determining protein MreD
MNHPVARFLPSIALVLTTLAGALPWSALAGATGSTTSAGVMLPLAVIHGCGLWRGASLPAGVVFLAGLLADVLTAGPLGYWPLIYLLGLIVVRFCVSRTQVELPNILAGWLSCTVSVMLLGFAAWAISSLYQLQWIGWRALAWPVGSTIAAYPIVALLLVVVARLADGGRSLRSATSE